MSERTTILVPVDFSTFSRSVVERALLLASARGTDLRLLYVLQPPAVEMDPGVTEPIWPEWRSSERAKLEQLRSEFEGRGVDVQTSFEEGDPSRIICSVASEPGTELIAMGSHGRRGLDRLLLGSVAERTLQGAPVPVMIVRQGATQETRAIGSVLFATDFSESARRTEDYVSSWATALGAEVEVLHVLFETTALFAPYAIPDTSGIDGEVWAAAERKLESVVSRFSSAGIQAKGKVVRGFAAEEILEHAESSDCELVALGAHGHAGIGRFRLGGVAQRVLRHAPCSVLVVGEGVAAGGPRSD